MLIILERKWYIIVLVPIENNAIFRSSQLVRNKVRCTALSFVLFL